VKAPVTGRYTAIMSPIGIRNVVVKNRVVRTAHGTQLTHPHGELPGAHLVNDELIAFHVERAKGGVGLSILESASVHQSSYGELRGWNDDIVDGLGRLADAVHEYDMRVFQQLQHHGHHSKVLNGDPAWGISSMPSTDPRPAPLTMTKTMIDELVAGFGAAAARVVQAGMDGIELHAGHGYLLAQSLSPAVNRRTDEYGGSPDNRMRLLKEALAAVREHVPAGFPVGVRLSASEWANGGIEPADTVAIIQALEGAGLIDFVNVSAGNHLQDLTIFGYATYEHGFQMPASRLVTEQATVPTIVTGRFMTLDEGEAVLRAGEADLVSFVRATIADPYLVTKTLAGLRPRPCTGTNQGCLAQPGGSISCAVNASAGRELEFTDSIKPDAGPPRRVLVVGAGPAGLEAARVVAARGHQVTVMEAADELGGRLRFARRVPGSKEMGTLVDWLAGEVERLGVRVLTGQRATAAAASEHGPFDVAVIAAGARDIDVPLVQAGRHEITVPGIETTDIVRPGDLLLATAPMSGPLLVLDDVGSYEALATVYGALDRGCQVALVTRLPTPFPQLEASLANNVARLRFANARVDVFVRSYLKSIDRGTVTVGSLDGGPDREVRATAIVPITSREPNQGLVPELARVIGKVIVVGDARSERFMQAAIADANRAAREI
jgi:2,4-dienoyl-CoA reductase-like NADH-dependent reductase (Old Yellow Enzyme family)